MLAHQAWVEIENEQWEMVSSMDSEYDLGIHQKIFAGFVKAHNLQESFRQPSYYETVTEGETD